MHAAEGMLHLLKAEPTLLPPCPVPVSDIALAIERRRKDEVHSCLRCGKRAQVAFVAEFEHGNRWLDLCAACEYWLRMGIDA